MTNRNTLREQYIKRGIMTGEEFDAQTEVGERAESANVFVDDGVFFFRHANGVVERIRGSKGDRGERGDRGIDGVAGRGIRSLQITEAGTLEVEYTDGARADLGRVVGEDGPQGPAGRDGTVTAVGVPRRLS